MRRSASCAMPRLRPSVLTSALALLVGGCDASSGPVSLDDVLVLDVVAGAPAVVAFTTEGTPGCYVPIAHRTRVVGTVVSVEVDGLDVAAGYPCRAITPSSFAVALPMGVAGDLRIEVRHRGETDAYVVRGGDDGPVLDPVRTSVTRLGPR